MVKMMAASSAYALSPETGHVESVCFANYEEAIRSSAKKELQVRFTSEFILSCQRAGGYHSRGMNNQILICPT
jgi:hypothetical protein